MLVDTVFELGDLAQFAIVRGKRVLADVADRFDGELAGFGIGHLDFEIRPSLSHHCDHKNGPGGKAQDDSAMHSQILARKARASAI